MRCQNQFSTCTIERNFGCSCQLTYSFRRVNIDAQTFVPQKFRGKEVNSFTLLDYGLLNKLWVQQMDITPYFPHKLGACIWQLHELEPYESFIIWTINNSPPEWIDLWIELARHVIKLEAKEIIQKPVTIKEYLPSDPDKDWHRLQTLGHQLKHWRASTQGSSWLWDHEHYSMEFILIAETFTEKIYWPTHVGNTFSHL